mgnify:CR=1 FL=1
MRWRRLCMGSDASISSGKVSLLERAMNRIGRYDLRSEYAFYPGRNWRFDFAIPAHKVAIEVEGAVWNDNGRHTRLDGYMRDLEKYNAAAACRWKLIRVTPTELLSLKTIKMIVMACQK